MSLEFNLVEPILVSDGTSRIEIESGRHLLMELVVDSLHPNSVSLGGDENAKRIEIVTGPSSSGKSVYLKVQFFVQFRPLCVIRVFFFFYMEANCSNSIPGSDRILCSCTASTFVSF